MKLDDDQSCELSKLVNAILSTEAGRNELEKIFNEADEFGEEAGSVLRNIWETDTLQADKDEFYKDQLTCGKFFFYYSNCTIYSHYFTTFSHRKKEQSVVPSNNSYV